MGEPPASIDGDVSTPALVLLHGWGLHGGIFAPLAAHYMPRYRVSAPDLPGHGACPYEPYDDLDGLAALMERRVEADCVLVGWSLGGMIAAAIAAAGRVRVARLVLVATTPRFVAVPGWPHGLPEATVAGFARRLASDFRALLGEFLTLQARGDDDQRALIRRLRAEVFARGEPTPAGLAAALEVLRSADLRDRLRQIAVPTLVLSGEYDRITPAAAGEVLAHGIPGARHVLLPHASHAPFLSRTDAFLVEMDAFLNDRADIVQVRESA